MTGRVQVYVWHGFDTERYRIVSVLSQTEEHAVMILESMSAQTHPWCVHSQGKGKCFKTYTEAMNYCQYRRWAN